jgi:hypothetical protein
MIEPILPVRSRTARPRPQPASHRRR